MNKDLPLKNRIFIGLVIVLTTIIALPFIIAGFTLGLMIAPVLGGIKVGIGVGDELLDLSYGVFKKIVKDSTLKK